MRTVVTFESTAFNTREPRDYFINPCCFGDDVAKWLMSRMRAAGLRTEDEPGQEDFGWYFEVHVPEGRHCVVIGFREGDPAALQGPEIRNARWHEQKDFDALREDLGAHTP